MEPSSALFRRIPKITSLLNYSVVTYMYSMNWREHGSIICSMEVRMKRALWSYSPCKWRNTNPMRRGISTYSPTGRTRVPLLCSQAPSPTGFWPQCTSDVAGGQGDTGEMLEGGEKVTSRQSQLLRPHIPDPGIPPAPTAPPATVASRGC